MHWIFLFIAGLFEITWAVGLKMVDGLSKIFPIVVTVVGMNASFVFLYLAMKKIPLSISYAVWTGIGIVGTVLFGILYFHESVSLPQIICVAMIVCGIVGLRLLS